MSRLSVAAAGFLAVCACGDNGAPKIPLEGDDLPGPIYQEPHRPQFHFTPAANWMNDPNGLVYYDGDYHLFYQYYPDDIVWGPMHWGHAVSRDLVRWQHLPIALYPDEKGYIFSGSAAMDWKNTSGLGDGEEPPMLAFFTYHDRDKAEAKTRDHESQGLAFSLDRGRSWTKYEGNPVLPNPGDAQDFRDPNVFWHAQSEQWVMVLAAHDKVLFYGAPDAATWTFLSMFGEGVGAHGGVWECPDFFPIRVEETGDEKWVLIQSLYPGGPQGGVGTQFFVGDFDGKEFVVDERFASQLEEDGPAWLDWGRDNYAGVTWSDIPAEDGRRLFIGWMSNWDYAQKTPTTPWRSAMTLPREISLHEEAGRYQLRSLPAREFLAHASDNKRQWDLALQGAFRLPADPALASQSALSIEFQRPPSGRIAVVLGNERGEVYRIAYDAEESRFISDRTEAGPNDFADNFSGIHMAPRIAQSDRVRMDIYVDRASMELFADGGRTVMTETFFPSQRFTSISLDYDSEAAWPVSVVAAEIESIWANTPER